MKIIKKANGDNSLLITKSEWLKIGKNQGWMKKAETVGDAMETGEFTPTGDPANPDGSISLSHEAAEAIRNVAMDLQFQILQQIPEAEVLMPYLRDIFKKLDELEGVIRVRKDRERHTNGLQRQ